MTDRRLFTSDGELRQEVSEEEITSKPAPAPPVPEAASAAQPKDALDPSVPPAPTAAEQKEQADAYRKSSRDLDARVELSGHSAKEMEMTFERFMASLYMTAMLQLGLMQEERGQPRIDLLGARQTIDTLSLLSEKTKGNLTPEEARLLDSALFELRMAFLEITQALARSAAAKAPAGARPGPGGPSIVR